MCVTDLVTLSPTRNLVSGPSFALCNMDENLVTLKVILVLAVLVTLSQKDSAQNDPGDTYTDSEWRTK